MKRTTIIIESMGSANILEKVNCFWLKRLFVVFAFSLVSYLAHSQIKMPDMVQPNDTWGLVDVNKLYGGCMQFNTKADLLNLDVQFLKKGMLFIVYDEDGNNGNGLQTNMYMFLPPSGVWDYTDPFLIPSAKQANTLSTMPDNLAQYLTLVVAGSGLTSGSSPNMTNKKIVYFDTVDSKFYRYDEGTESWVEISTSVTASNVSVTVQNGITSNNVQAALEELQTEITNTNTEITDDITTATPVYPTWVNGTTGNLSQNVSSSKLSLVPSTGILTASGYVGNSVSTTGNANLTLTTGSGSTIVSNLQSNGAMYIKGYRGASTLAAAAVTATDYIIDLQFSGGVNIYGILPDPTTIAVGRIIVLRNSSARYATGGTYTFGPPDSEYLISNSNTLQSNLSMTLICDGQKWIRIYE